jgi:hypothetical protein
VYSSPYARSLLLLHTTILVQDAIRATACDCRRALQQNIVLTGALSLMPNFAHTLKERLKNSSGQANVSIPGIGVQDEFLREQRRQRFLPWQVVAAPERRVHTLAYLSCTSSWSWRTLSRYASFMHAIPHNLLTPLLCLLSLLTPPLFHTLPLPRSLSPSLSLSLSASLSHPPLFSLPIPLSSQYATWIGGSIVGSQPYGSLTIYTLVAAENRVLAHPIIFFPKLLPYTSADAEGGGHNSSGPPDAIPPPPDVVLPPPAAAGDHAGGGVELITVEEMLATLRAQQHDTAETGRVLRHVETMPGSRTNRPGSGTNQVVFVPWRPQWGEATSQALLGRAEARGLAQRNSAAKCL